ncbi:hypothetical protein V8F33_011386 [Rhypophila sp. PSN 637]
MASVGFPVSPPLLSNLVFPSRQANIVSESTLIINEREDGSPSQHQATSIEDLGAFQVANHIQAPRDPPEPNKTKAVDVLNDLILRWANRPRGLRERIYDSRIENNPEAYHEALYQVISEVEDITQYCTVTAINDPEVDQDALVRVMRSVQNVRAWADQAVGDDFIPVRVRVPGCIPGFMARPAREEDLDNGEEGDEVEGMSDGENQEMDDGDQEPAQDWSYDADNVADEEAEDGGDQDEDDYMKEVDDPADSDYEEEEGENDDE